MIALTLVPAGDRARAEIDKLRATIAKLVDERTAVESAGLQPADAFDRVLREIRHRADVDQNSLGFLTAPDGYPAMTATPMTLIDTWAQLWQVMPEFIEKGLRSYFERACVDSGLPLAKRPGRLREIDAKLEELREEEERVWLSLLSRNLLIERLGDAQPEDIDRILRVWDQVA